MNEDRTRRRDLAANYGLQITLKRLFTVCGLREPDGGGKLRSAGGAESLIHCYRIRIPHL